jgi:hypothetical protein
MLPIRTKPKLQHGAARKRKSNEDFLNLNSPTLKKQKIAETGSGGTRVVENKTKSDDYIHDD